MTHLPLFGSRSWNNGLRYVSCYILIKLSDYEKCFIPVNLMVVCGVIRIFTCHKFRQCVAINPGFLMAYYLMIPPQFEKRLTVSHLSHDDVIKWKHFPRYWPFVRGIHRSPVNSPHKGQWRGALMISLICVWINGWVNSREAGDLRRYRAHYDVIVMWFTLCFPFASSHKHHYIYIFLFIRQNNLAIICVVLYFAFKHVLPVIYH